MAKTINLETAQELAADLAGSLEHLSVMHATIAALESHGNEHALLAATFSTLHGSAERLAALLEDRR